jgi:hypothetical protein
MVDGVIVVSYSYVVAAVVYWCLVRCDVALSIACRDTGNLEFELGSVN